MSEVRTEQGYLVPGRYQTRWQLWSRQDMQNHEVVVSTGLELISDLAHAEAKYAAAEQAWQKDAADKNKLVEMLTTRVRELEALLSRLAEDNAALRAQVERLRAPVTDEELRAICDPIFGFVPPEDIDRLLRARAAKEQP